MNLAKSDVIQFKKDHGCKPTKRDLPGINQAINNEYWIDFDIKTWNDFMKFIFGEVNTKRNGYYKGKAGLERALQEARDIFYQKRKLPVKRDMRTVYSLINDRNYWTEYGINSWSDFRDRI